MIYVVDQGEGIVGLDLGVMHDGVQIVTGWIRLRMRKYNGLVRCV